MQLGQNGSSARAREAATTMKLSSLELEFYRMILRLSVRERKHLLRSILRRLQENGLEDDRANGGCDGC